MKMKQIFSFLLINLVFNTSFAQTQLGIPEAPKKIEFANIIVELDPAAQKAVNAEITNLLTPQNKYLELKLERMQWYFPIIEKILEQEDIPEDMKYLAVMESSLLPESISTSNAVGFWQFKEATAKEVGLIVDNNQDDRKSIHLSTKGAAMYMKRNNLIFKNWISCLLAYYLGVQGASDKIPADWSYASEVKFNENTNPYLIKAIANRIAFEHRLNRIKDSPKKFVEYTTKGKSLAEISIELATDITDLRKYNSWLYASNIPEDKFYDILILSKIEDENKITASIQKRTNGNNADLGFPQLKRITMVATSPDDPIFYQINGKKGILAQSGEEVAQLSSKAKIKIAKFLSFNDMTDKDLTKEGNVYYLQKKSKRAKVPFHNVQKDQTLWDVSQMYGIGLKYILKYNRMKSSEILQSGRVLWLQKTRPKKQPIEIIKEANEVKDSLPVKEDYTKIDVVVTNDPIKTNEQIDKLEEQTATSKMAVITPETTKTDIIKIDNNSPEPKKSKPTVITPPVKVEETKTVNTKSVSTKHIVKQGETLFSIAKRYGLSVGELCKMNGINTTSNIKTNQSLTVEKSDIAVKEVLVTKTTPTNKKPNLDDPIGEEALATIKIPAKQISSSTKETQIHTVASGETLFSISKKYGVTVNQLQNWNSLTSNSINQGQTLIVSLSKSQTSAAPGKTQLPGSVGIEYHTVTKGETLFSISRKYDSNVSDIKKWNNMNDNNIMVGSKIIVKK